MDEMFAEWYTTFALNPSIIKRQMVLLLRHTVHFYTISLVNFWHFFPSTSYFDIVKKHRCGISKQIRVVFMEKLYWYHAQFKH